MDLWGWRSRAGAVGPGCGSGVTDLLGGAGTAGGAGAASAALGDVGGGWLEGWPCCQPAGPRGSPVPVPGPVGLACALLTGAVWPMGCLAWAHLCNPQKWGTYDFCRNRFLLANSARERLVSLGFIGGQALCKEGKGARFLFPCCKRERKKEDAADTVLGSTECCGHTGRLFRRP